MGVVTGGGGGGGGGGRGPTELSFLQPVVLSPMTKRPQAQKAKENEMFHCNVV